MSCLVKVFPVDMLVLHLVAACERIYLSSSHQVIVWLCVQAMWSNLCGNCRQVRLIAKALGGQY